MSRHTPPQYGETFFRQMSKGSFSHIAYYLAMRCAGSEEPAQVMAALMGELTALVEAGVIKPAALARAKAAILKDRAISARRLAGGQP